MQIIDAYRLFSAGSAKVFILLSSFFHRRKNASYSFMFIYSIYFISVNVEISLLVVLLRLLYNISLNTH